MTRSSLPRFALLLMVNIGAVALPGAAPEPGVDPHIAPGDDFFAYANGDWLNSTTLPDRAARWGARNEIDAATRRQVADVITTAVNQRASRLQRKVADFYAAYLDAAAIEASGQAPLTPLLEGVNQLQDKTALAKWLGSHLPADVDPLNQGLYDSSQLFGLSVEYGIHGETTHFAYLLQGGLGLGTREQYLGDAPPMQELRDRYQSYVSRQLELAGFDHPGERAAAVLALETSIAQAHATLDASANDRNADHHWGRADFSLRAPGLDWNAFFTAAGLEKQNDFVAWQPEAIQGTAALIASQPLSVWQDYLRFHLIDRYAEVLPHSFAEAALAFHHADAPLVDTRAQRAIVATNQFMSLAVGRLYVEKYFPPAAKAKVQSILGNVLDAFRRRVEVAPWMTAATRARALIKLDKMYFGVGYPEKWPDDTQLRIDARDALGNLQRVAAWNYRQSLAKLDRPVDRHEWVIAPQSAVAVLNFQQNSYNFSAALLQPPKFDARASDATNYGAIGAILGHEMSHFVDTLGADFDARGAQSHWWTATDTVQYEAACRALVDQFSAYRPLAEVSINGKLTLGENVADLGGLSAAFDAYRRALGSTATNRQYLSQQDRQFFIGFARAWRAKITDEAFRAQSSGDSHAPEPFRIATVRNLDAWYDAFGVQPGQRLYLEPQARAHIW